MSVGSVGRQLPNKLEFIRFYKNGRCSNPGYSCNQDENHKRNNSDASSTSKVQELESATKQEQIQLPSEEGKVIEANRTGVEGKHSQPLRIHQKPEDGFSFFCECEEISEPEV